MWTIDRNVSIRPGGGSVAEINARPEMERDLRFFPVERDPKRLSPEQIKEFNRLGYIFPIEMFDAAAVSANRAYFKTLMDMALAAGKNSYDVAGWHTTCRGLYDLAVNERILDYVEDIIGPDIVCKMTHYFSKDPGDTKSVYWHQDAQFWLLTPSKVVTVWLAIDDVDEENGAMNLFAGSHRVGIIPFEWVTEEESGVLNQHIHDPWKYGNPVSVNLKAGEFSMHTDMIIHGSMPNPSNRRRCGLTLRYMPPDVRSNEPDHGRAIVCRGSDPSGYWEHIPRPQGEAMPT